MEILSGVIFTIIIIFIFPVKILVSYGILDKYIKNTEWAVEPLNSAGSIIIVVWLIISGLIIYWLIRTIILGIYRFIKKGRK